MQMEKLFQVLVVGGALLGGQAFSLTGTELANGSRANAVSLDCGSEPPPLDPIFCTSEEACPKDATGQPKVKDGFVCCWGTSCEPQPQS